MTSTVAEKRSEEGEEEEGGKREEEAQEKERKKHMKNRPVVPFTIHELISAYPCADEKVT